MTGILLYRYHGGMFMPVYKDEKRNTWYAQFYYEDWTGEKKKTTKRGFKTQREAKEYEREFLLKRASNPNMLFTTLCELYFEDCSSRIREGTMANKRAMFETHITPYFKTKRISDITTGDIRRWQNTLLQRDNPQTGRRYAETYLRTLNSQLSAVFNFAVQFHNLPYNPCKNLKAIGKKQSSEMKFWTLDQFNKVIACESKDAYHLVFMLLFWTGMRVGECLALTHNSILKDSKSLDIRYSHHRIDGEDVLGPTKTENSIRVTSLPDFVYDELINYTERIYGLQDDERIFYFQKTALNKELDRISKLAGVERIRVHDLRHSHVSLLVELGYSVHAIADRIGDTPEMVNKTYAHLYPDKGRQIADELNKHKDGFHTSESSE